jgi:hypothetical protein
MTWLADAAKDRPTGKALDKLLAQREQLVKDIEALKASPCGKSQAAINGRIEDLTAIAKKVTSIDRKIGRI